MAYDAPMERTHTTGMLGSGRSASTQTYVLEYHVSELADGSTPAPQFAIEGAIPSDGPTENNEQIYVFQVPRLGLIDLSLSGILPPELADNPSGLGQRYVVYAFVRDFVLASVSPVQSANEIGAEGYVNLEALETLPILSTQFYSRKGYIMPHGTVLRVADMAPKVAGQPFMIRIGIVVPQSVKEDAEMRGALCCTDGIPTTVVEECVTPNFLTPGVDPNALTPGVNTIQINAYPISPGFTQVTVEGPFAPVVPTNVQFVFPNTILFTANFADAGAYSVTLSNGAGCSAQRVNAFTVG